MPLNYGNLRRLFEAKQPQVASAEVAALFKERHVTPTDVDLGKLFVECFGWSNYQACRSGALFHEVMESSGAVNTSMFTAISGQMVVTAVMNAYENEEFVFTQMIPEQQTPFLDGEKIPGISPIGDEAMVVPEGEPFPRVGVSQDWIETAAPRKRGMRLDVTREAVFGDRTGLLLERCAQVGYWLGVNREKRAIDCVIDENAGATSITAGGHRYHWRGTSYATYQSSTPWDNVTANNALVDWTDVEAAELTLAAITDPNTGEPIAIMPTKLIVTPQLNYTARSIVNATMIRRTTPGFATSANPNQSEGPNWVNPYDVVSSRLLAARLATDTDWFLGAPEKAFVYMVNFPMQVKTLGANSMLEYERDIVQSYRADERGAYVTKDPRLMNKSTA